jgi:hypothetical protein
MLDRPASKRAEGGRSHRFADAKIETSMMPGTPNRTINYQSIDERAMVVSTVRSNCEEIIAVPNQQHGVFADMTQKLLSVGEFAFRNT